MQILLDIQGHFFVTFKSSNGGPSKSKKRPEHFNLKLQYPFLVSDTGWQNCHFKDYCKFFLSTDIFKIVLITYWQNKLLNWRSISQFVGIFLCVGVGLLPSLTRSSWLRFFPNTFGCDWLSFAPHKINLQTDWIIRNLHNTIKTYRELWMFNGRRFWLKTDRPVLI